MSRKKCRVIRGGRVPTVALGDWSRAPGRSGVLISLRPPAPGGGGLIPILLLGKLRLHGEPAGKAGGGEPLRAQLPLFLGVAVPGSQHQEGPHRRAGPRPPCVCPFSSFLSQLVSLEGSRAPWGAPGLHSPCWGWGWSAHLLLPGYREPTSRQALARSQTQKQEVLGREVSETLTEP